MVLAGWTCTHASSIWQRCTTDVRDRLRAGGEQEEKRSVVCKTAGAAALRVNPVSEPLTRAASITISALAPGVGFVSIRPAGGRVPGLHCESAVVVCAT